MEKKAKKNKSDWDKPSFKSIKFSQTYGGSMPGIHEDATTLGYNGTTS